MNICVFGAASNSIDATYLSAGRALGRELARRGHTLVFGGGAGGLMGAVAVGVNEGGGKCVGVVPAFLDVDGALYEGCAELIRTETHTCYQGVRETLHDWGYGCAQCPPCELRANGWRQWRAHAA